VLKERSIIVAPVWCFRLQYLAPFRNQIASVATDVENRGKKYTTFRPLKS